MAGLSDPISKTERALLGAIIAAPADDAPRLVYADWLLDHGSSAHGQLITVGCELARLRAAKVADERVLRLFERETELLYGPELGWLPAFAKLQAQLIGRETKPVRGLLPASALASRPKGFLDRHLALERLAPFATRLGLFDCHWPTVSLLGERGALDRFDALEFHDASWATPLERPLAPAELPRLRRLVLSSSQLRSSDIDHLFAHPQPELSEVVFEYSGLETGAFARFVQRAPPKLRAVTIHGCNIYELELAGLLHLSLAKLEIINAWVPPILAERLEQAIPSCTLRVQQPLAIG